MSASKNLRDAAMVVNLLLIIGFLGLVWLIIYGNLSGNLGFASGTQGYNDTQNVILNLTDGTTTFFAYAPTWFIITAIVVLIGILLGLLIYAVKILKMTQTKGAFTG